MRTKDEIQQAISDLDSVLPNLIAAGDRGSIKLNTITRDALAWTIGTPGTSCGIFLPLLRDLCTKQETVQCD